MRPGRFASNSAVPPGDDFEVAQAPSPATESDWREVGHDFVGRLFRSSPRGVIQNDALVLTETFHTGTVSACALAQEVSDGSLCLRWNGTARRQS